MSETVFYVRGELPFGPAREIPPAMVHDAKVLLELEPPLLETVVEQLDSAPGFLDWDSLARVIGEVIPNEENARRLTRLIFVIHDQLRATGQPVEVLLQQIEETVQRQEGSNKLLTNEEMAELHRRFPAVVKPYPGLARQAKAQRLAAATGTPLESVDLICDARPIFNEERSAVEGVIPLTTLRVVSKGADGLPIAFEAVLTQSQVKELARKAVAAESKLDSLKKTLNSHAIVIPSTPMTTKG